MKTVLFCECGSENAWEGRRKKEEKKDAFSWDILFDVVEMSVFHHHVVSAWDSHSLCNLFSPSSSFWFLKLYNAMSSLCLSFKIQPRHPEHHSSREQKKNAIRGSLVFSSLLFCLQFFVACIVIVSIYFSLSFFYFSSLLSLWMFRQVSMSSRERGVSLRHFMSFSLVFASVWDQSEMA